MFYNKNKMQRYNKRALKANYFTYNKRHFEGIFYYSFEYYSIKNKPLFDIC